MRTHALPSLPTKESRSSFEFFLYTLLCLGVAACGGDGSTGVDENGMVDPCQAASQILMGQPFVGQLDTDDCLQLDGAFGDRWRLSLPGQTNVRIDFSSSAFDTFLELQDDLGNPIAQNHDAGTTVASRIIQPLQAGAYIILARSFGPGQTGSYQLRVSEGPDCSPVGSLQLGQTVAGILADDDCLSEVDGSLDHWSLSLTSAQKVWIDLQSADFDEVVLVRDRLGNIIFLAEESSTIGHARIESQLSAGEWTISVASHSPTARGSYDLTVDVAPPCTPGTDLVLGESVAGDVSSTDCLINLGAPADSFGIHITEETAIRFHMKSPDFDPLLTLRDAIGILITFGAEAAGNGNAWIRESLGPGSYIVIAGATTLTAEGSYQLTVSEIVCTDLQAIDFGQTVMGTLDIDDCRRSNGAFQESWTLVLANDTTARIDLKSDAFDAFLTLKDSDGNVLDTNDDRASGETDSRIDRALTAGTYEIVVSSFRGNADQIGAYDLTVDVPPPVPTAAVGAARTGAP
jgi:hypothetical protein